MAVLLLITQNTIYRYSVIKDDLINALPNNNPVGETEPINI